MRRDLPSYRRFQVFLNYPFDDEFMLFEDAMHFAVAAAGLIPVCAKDLSTPDKPRLFHLVDALANCQYSAHDFSRYTGEGANNFARFNCPIEMGMALFHAIATQLIDHRCSFFVSHPHDYKEVASDLGGLDPKCYQDESSLVSALYEWLRSVVPSPVVNRVPTIKIVRKYEDFKVQSSRLDGCEKGGRPSHDEKQELIFSICSELSWWDHRDTKGGTLEFQKVPLAWKDQSNQS